MLLAFGATANAQQKSADKATAQQEYAKAKKGFNDAATKDIATLSEFVKLTSDQKVKLQSLFAEKHRMHSENLSNERKAVAKQSIEASFKSALTPDQLSKVEGNTQLMQTLLTI